MSPEVETALIVGISTILVAIIGAYAASRRAVGAKIEEAVEKVVDKLNDAMLRIGQMQIKLDTLWSIYAEDAIRKARDTGMVASNSPLYPTEKWFSLVPDHTMHNIMLDARGLSGDIDHITASLWPKYEKQMVDIVEESDASILDVFGAFYIVCRNAAELS